MATLRGCQNAPAEPIAGGDKAPGCNAVKMTGCRDTSTGALPRAQNRLAQLENQVGDDESNQARPERRHAVFRRPH